MPGLDLGHIPRFRIGVQVRCLDKLPRRYTQIACTLEVALKLLLADSDVKLGHLCIPEESSNRDPKTHTHSLVKMNVALTVHRPPTSKSTMSLVDEVLLPARDPLSTFVSISGPIRTSHSCGH